MSIKFKYTRVSISSPNKDASKLELYFLTFAYTEFSFISKENEKHIIKKQLVFPQKGMYGSNTDMGRFMENLTLYNATGQNPNDDAPDACALFGSEVIEENSKPQVAEALPFIRQFF